ncbi:MAG: long-chain fatty acid--CoA ligase [Actinomycetota bacterium]
MSYELIMRNILERPARLFPDKEALIYKDRRMTYPQLWDRVMTLGNVLKKLGMNKGDRIATMAWNTLRHLELYFGAPLSGGVLHTVNLRLHPNDIVFIMNHAEDSFFFVDDAFVPMVEAIADQLLTVKGYVVMTDGDLPETSLSPVYSYEELMGQEGSDFTWPDLSENDPATMCYTTATTGTPKGVVFTHRQAYLHSLTVLAELGISEEASMIHVVPMFHAHSWGAPYAATWAGAKQVYPERFDVQLFCELIQQEKVNISCFVPTILNMILNFPDVDKYDLSSLEDIYCGGSATPRAMMEAADKLGIRVNVAYGATETFPLVSVSKLRANMQDLPEEEKYDIRLKAGCPTYGVEAKVINDDGEEVDRDGQEVGEIWMRGPWIADHYYNDPVKSAEYFAEGWWHSGDLATVNEQGYITIVDRAKDAIKSGGEWIISTDLESILLTHPAVLEAAVIGVPHDKWGEVAHACVVLKEDYKGKVGEEELLGHFSGKVAKWQIPKSAGFYDELPKTSVGKIAKRVLREEG